METFTGFNLPPSILEALGRMSFEKPTPIQAAAIPVALQGCDVLGSAQTGTGKTVAFVIPMVSWLLSSPDSTALILTPTRELAIQVQDVVRQVIERIGLLKSVLLIGGSDLSKQKFRLKKFPQIFIGTPGRINDHLKRKSLNLSKTDFVVFDEIDRMLDMGFYQQIEDIIKRVPRDRQTLMFSATLPPKIVQLAQRYLRTPKRIAVDSTQKPAHKIKQEVLRMPQDEKYQNLISELNARDGSILIFARTRRATDNLARKLKREKFNADAIHGNLRQGKRKSVITAFRKQGLQILVATDIAARGLDIPHIEHVINYDLPDCPEDYIHRIGRTARAGNEGQALCLISPKDTHKWQAIEDLINPDKKGSNQGPGKGSKRGSRKPGRSRKPRFPRSGKPGKFSGNQKRRARGGNPKGAKSASRARPQAARSA